MLLRQISRHQVKVETREDVGEQVVLTSRRETEEPLFREAICLQLPIFERTNLILVILRVSV